MAKSKNATTHHLGRKVHKNGIHKPKDHRYKSSKACNLRWIRNKRHAVKMDPSIKKSVNLTKRIEKQRAKK